MSRSAPLFFRSRKTRKIPQRSRHEFETRSLPPLSVSGFTFYVARPLSFTHEFARNDSSLLKFVTIDVIRVSLLIHQSASSVVACKILTIFCNAGQSSPKEKVKAGSGLPLARRSPASAGHRRHGKKPPKAKKLMKGNKQMKTISHIIYAAFALFTFALPLAFPSAEASGPPLPAQGEFFSLLQLRCSSSPSR